jgi:hypothetical protein
MSLGKKPAPAPEAVVDLATKEVGSLDVGRVNAFNATDEAADNKLLRTVDAVLDPRSAALEGLEFTKMNTNVCTLMVSLGVVVALALVHFAGRASHPSTEGTLRLPRFRVSLRKR